MQLPAHWILCGLLTWTWARADAKPRACCPPGHILNPGLACPPAAPTFHTAFPNLENGESVCIPRRDSSTNGTAQAPGVPGLEPGLPGLEPGLPGCPAHSMVLACGNISALFPAMDGDLCVEADGTAIVCPCASGTCVRKCCDTGQLFDNTAGLCVRNDSVPDWRPSEVDESALLLLTGSFPPECETPHLLKVPHHYNSHLRCFSEADLTHRDQFTFNADASVQVNKYPFALAQEAYCGDHTLHEGGVMILNNLLVCLPQQTQARPVKFDVYGGLLIVGGCFLLLTVLISCLLPDLRATLYHKVAICHNGALMVASFTWGVANLQPAMSYPTCVTLSLVIQLTFLASFFWMNVMCIDIALAFKNLRSVYGPAVNKGWGSLGWYSLYAWGCPLLLMGITAAMELLPHVPRFIVRPGFGCKNCGFNPDTYAILVYLYGPMMFILVFNSVLFVMTLLKIRAVEKQTAILKARSQRKAVNSYAEAHRVLLFGKMFVLMGLTWGTEVVGWWVGGPAVVWYLPDLINFLRAIFLCFLFVGKRSVLTALRARLGGVDTAALDLADSHRRSKSSSTERRDQAEVDRRGRILARQITQNFRISGQSVDSQM